LGLFSFNHSHPTKPLSQTRHLEYRRILAGSHVPVHQLPSTQPHIASQANVHKLSKDPPANTAKTKEIRDRLARLLRMLPRQTKAQRLGAKFSAEHPCDKPIISPEPE